MASFLFCLATSSEHFSIALKAYPYLIIIPVIWFWHSLRFINVHLRFLLTLCKSDTCRTNWQTIPFICIVSHALLIYHSGVDPYMKSHSIFEISLIMFAPGIWITDKETDESWNIFIIWKINSGLVCAAWQWKKSLGPIKSNFWGPFSYVIKGKKWI